MLTSASKILLGIAPHRARRPPTAARTNSKLWDGRFLEPSSFVAVSTPFSYKHGHLSSKSFSNRAGTVITSVKRHRRYFASSSSNSEDKALPEDKKVVDADSKNRGESQGSGKKEETMTEQLERLRKESERFGGRSQSTSQSGSRQRDASDHDYYSDLERDAVRESRLRETASDRSKGKSGAEASQGRDLSRNADAKSATGEGSLSSDEKLADEGGNELGRIKPKKLTIEEAAALGIDVDEALGKSTRQGKVLWENPETKKKREEDERLKKIAESDGKPRYHVLYDPVVKFTRENPWWLFLAALVLAPSLLSIYSNWDSDKKKRFRGLQSSGSEFRPNWKREEYSCLSDTWTEQVIFEMCTLAALSALPSINPITSPLTAIRGDIAAVYPKDRQGEGPPTFWKLRVDFPAPRETEWEKNDKNIVRVQPASVTYKGAQFMWILSRTWEGGEPVIRILMGRQVGGTTKSNPKRSLIPWREPAFRPRRLNHWLQSRFEIDAMFKQLYEEKTMLYRTLKVLGREDEISRNKPSYDLEDYEYDMLEVKGFTDYLYYPDSVPWPSNNLIIDPLGVLQEGSNDDEIPLAWEDTEFSPAQFFADTTDYNFASEYKEDSEDYNPQYTLEESQQENASYSAHTIAVSEHAYQDDDDYDDDEYYDEQDTSHNTEHTEDYDSEDDDDNYPPPPPQARYSRYRA